MIPSLLLNKLEQRILEISYKHGLSHLSSCLTSLPIILEIYQKLSIYDKFVLSSAHSGLALYVVLEEYFGYNAEELFKNIGIHPLRRLSKQINVSGGSLGSGILIATGMAIVNNHRNIHCLISDGECAEGSVWEALRFINEHKLSNLKVYVNINGYSAYDKIDVEYLKKRLISFSPEIIIRETNVDRFPFLRGIDAHYYKLSKKDFEIK